MANLESLVRKVQEQVLVRGKNIIWDRKLEKTIQESDPGAQGLRYEYGVDDQYDHEADKFI